MKAGNEKMAYWYVELISDTGVRYVIGDQAEFSLVKSMAKRASPGEKIRFRPPQSATRSELIELAKLGAKKIKA